MDFHSFHKNLKGSKSAHLFFVNLNGQSSSDNDPYWGGTEVGSDREGSCSRVVARVLYYFLVVVNFSFLFFFGFFCFLFRSFLICTSFLNVSQLSLI